MLDKRQKLWMSGKQLMLMEKLGSDIDGRGLAFYKPSKQSLRREQRAIEVNKHDFCWGEI